MIKKKNITQEDVDTWQDYIKNPTDITDKDIIYKKNVLNNHRFKYDLHGQTLVNANSKVAEIILSCLKKKL